MNEDRLRDALAARASTVRPDPAAYEAVVERRARRLRHRWLTVAGSAAATAALVVGVAVALPRGAAPRPPTASPAAAPEWGVALFQAQARLVRLPGQDGIDVPPLSGWYVTAVAAAGDGRTFYAAASQGCVSRLLRIDRNGSSATTEQVNGGHVTGKVTALTVSGDGRHLAYAARRPTRTGPDCRSAALGTVPELWVRDLATGTGRSWRGRPGENAQAQHVIVQSPTLSADGRYLAFDTDDCCDRVYDRFVRVLDTTAPGESFLDTPLFGGQRRDCRTYAPAYRGAYGTLTAVRQCGGEVTVVTIDPATGAETGEVFSTHPVGGAWGHPPALLDFDASGDHALVEYDNIELGPGIDRWDRGAVTKLGVRHVQRVSW